MNVSAVVPAYNEEKTIAGVVAVLKKSGFFAEIIVVSDGSTDRTAFLARQAGAKVIELLENLGKGEALSRGVATTKSPFLLFIDADLSGVTVEHLGGLLAPLSKNEAEMVVGVQPKYGERYKKNSNVFLTSGQRAMRREIFEQVPEKLKKGYQIEEALNYYCHLNNQRIKIITLPGILHPQKYEKRPWWQGILTQLKMYGQIVKVFILVRLWRLTMFIFWQFKKLIPKPVIRFYHFMLARLAAFIYHYPAGRMIVVGITGTGGKSTTVYLLAKLLEAAGWKVGVTSTILFKIGEREWLNDKKMTMLGRFQTQKFLHEMAKAGCQIAIIETTSQGIEQFRHLGINYDMAVLTNLYPEHLEAHGGFENYKKAKGKLFEVLSQGKRKPFGPVKTIIVNGDDENAEYFLSFPTERKITFSLNELKEAKFDEKGIHFIWQGAKFDLPFLGKFNLANVLCAFTISQSLGLNLSQIEQAGRSLGGVPGRLEFIQEGQRFMVMVDYAFEPRAFQGLYETIKLMPHQRVIQVFGSAGGGRDTSRRAQLGQIAGERADFVIITNEDPYDDDPELIMEQVAEGARQAGKKEGKNLFKILDRRQAIAFALSLAKEDDLVLITGKGAEQAICVKNGRKVPWDDRKEVREELKRLYANHSQGK